MTQSDHSRWSRRRLLTGAAAAGFAGIAGDRTAAFAKAPMANAQAPAFHRFKVGAFELTAVSDGPIHFGPPQANVFSETSKEDMT